MTECFKRKIHLKLLLEAKVNILLLSFIFPIQFVRKIHLIF